MFLTVYHTNESDALHPHRVNDSRYTEQRDMCHNQLSRRIHDLTGPRDKPIGYKGDRCQVKVQALQELPFTGKSRESERRTVP